MSLPTKTQKPQWLQTLEKESWQAELIISGVAIFGSLQMPALLVKLQNYLLLHFDQQALEVWYFAMVYWALFVYSLITLFILHFALRAVWIGLIGLNSVFTKGILPNTFNSKDFQEKNVKEYGDVDALIALIDRRASIMYGIGFAAANLFLNVGLIISLSVMMAFTLVDYGLASTSAQIIAASPAIAFLTVSIITSTLAHKSVREKAWVKRWHFPITKLLTQLSYPINNKFSQTAILLVTSESMARVRTTKDVIKYVVVVGLLCLGLGTVLGQFAIVAKEFKAAEYQHLGNQPNTYDIANYEDTKYTGLLFEPRLSTSHYHKNEPVYLWVPLPKREQYYLQKNCSLPKLTPNSNSDDHTNALHTVERQILCAQEYISLFVDNTALTTPLPIREFKYSAGLKQLGMRFILPNLTSSPGSHILKVETALPFSENNQPTTSRTTYIRYDVTDTNSHQ